MTVLVGIGTATPAEKLQVAGNIRVNNNGAIKADGSGYLQLGNTNNGLIRILGDGGTSRIRGESNSLQIETNRDNDDIIFAVNAGGTDSDETVVEAMRIVGSDGNVGIGTTTPVGKFSVQLADATSNGNVGAWDDTYALFGDASSTGGEAVGIGFGTYGGVLVSLDPGSAWEAMNYMAGAHYFKEANTVVMAIDGGHVGIGLQSPVNYSNNARCLQIHDETIPELRLTSDVTGSASGNGALLQVSGSDFYIWNAESGDISFATNSDVHMKLDENGNLGIGGSFTGHSVNGMLHVRDENDGSDQYSGIRFYPADSESSATDTDFYHVITGFRKGGLMLSGGQSGNYTRTYTTLNNDGFKVFTNAGDNTQINMSTQQRLLIPTGGGAATLSVGLNVSGALSATTKSFDIEHPTEEGKRLHHGSLEGPEHGVYIRGRLEGDTIELPDYWLGLVDEDTITVQLTPNKGFQQIYVDHIEDNKVYVGTQTDTPIDCFYFIQAERKDVEKMVVEY